MNESKTDRLGARAVRRLLVELGVPERRQASHLGELMGLSYPQALRKLSLEPGGAGWELDEFCDTCERLGADPMVALRAVLPATTATPAKVQIHGLWVDAKVELGEPFADAAAASGVALHAARGSVDELWRVLGAHQSAGPVTEYRRVNRIEIMPPAARRPRVAVLDDDPDVCDTLVDNLAAKGLDASGFYTLATFQAAITSGTTAGFEAFVLDWCLPDVEPADVLADLRARFASAPIVLISGKLASGEADEDGIASAVARYGATFYVKPAPLGLVAAGLHSALRKAASGGPGEDSGPQRLGS